ncbi:MAG: nucleotide sugar dehydrogenase [Candidatus Bathyarchaeota archaeon]|nr:nucleotide sugar dehydrogenase [Candidatus Bathyarchaeota archaeon]
MNIVVVGMGYVGIPVAALFADVPGFNVTGLQRRSGRSAWKIDALNQGKSVIEAEEPGLPELIKRIHDKGTFHVTDDLSVYREADAIIIAVQTPVDENHIPQYESLRSVLTDIGEHMKSGSLICLESTVAPGTTNHLAKPILEQHSGLNAGRDFSLLFSYERVMVGRLLHNLTLYDRIVGGIDPESTRRGIELYRHIVKANLHPTDALTAEVAKVTENAYRDVNIAFANEIAIICESLGVNVHDVRHFVNSLPNDSSNPSANPYRNMHTPGAGVGGHCLPKDSWLLKYGLDAYGSFKFEPALITGSRYLNDNMPSHMKELTEEALKEKSLRLRDAKLTLLGVAFIENSDDTRNTPAESLYKLLEGQCHSIIAHDPYVKEYETLKIIQNLNEAINDRDCLIVVTRHKEYLSLKPATLKKQMNTPIIVDGRNVFNQEECLKLGFSFRGVGLPKKASAKLASSSA